MTNIWPRWGCDAGARGAGAGLIDMAGPPGMRVCSAPPPQLVQGRAKVARRWGFDRHGFTSGVAKRKFVGVQCQPGDQRPLLLPAGGAIVALDAAEHESRRGAAARRVVERVDREREADVLEVDADLVRLAGFWEH